MTRNKIILIIGLVIIGVISTYSFIGKKTLSTNAVVSYPDEPKIETKVGGTDHLVVSTSSWIVPSNPVVISDINSAVIGETKPRFDQKSADEVWKSVYKLFPYFQNDLKKALTEMHISLSYYQYFYMNAYNPIYERSADLNNDGKADAYFGIDNMACAIHCDGIYAIFINNKPYTIKTNKGSLGPRADKKGFYLTDYIPDPEIPTAPTVTGVILRRYEWNGNGFTEVGEKTVQFATK